MPEAGPLGALGAFLAAPPPAYRSDAARARARMALVDLLGVTIAGTREPLADLLAAHHAANADRGAASLIGLAGTASPTQAAFLNGALGHALDFDDSSFVLGGHPSVVILPGLLALAEAGGHGGRAVLEAYVAGFEVLSRIAAAVNFHHYEKGWHPTATLGVFGAAAGAARLLGLDAGRAATALALAASCASGTKESFGTMAKPLQVGQAASRGVLAAQLAALGATAPASALDGARGYFALYNGAGTVAPDRLAIDPDMPELMRSGLRFKRYACCGATHVAIDAALQLRAQDGFEPTRIADVRLDVNPRRRPHVDRPVISEPLGAKFSLQYTVAAALLDGAVGLGHFTPEAVRRPDIAALMARVRVGDLPAAEGLAQPCRLEVTLDDGRSLRACLDAPLGRETDAYAAYMERKFHDCAGRALPPAAVARLWDMLGGIDGAEALTPLLRATQPAASAARQPGSMGR